MKNRYVWCTMALLAGLLWTPATRASAQTVPLANALTAVGRFATNQGYLVSYNFSTGQCARTPIGGPNGLTTTTFINGTPSLDWISMITIFGAVHCGPWGVMNPLVTNGNTVVINARAGDDLVDGQTFNNMLMGGDEGNDYVNSDGSNCVLWGFSGNDTLRAGSGSTLNGEAGNDTMCAVPGTTVWQFVGGPDSDTYCGSWTIAPSSATLNCSSC